MPTDELHDTDCAPIASLRRTPSRARWTALVVLPMLVVASATMPADAAQDAAQDGAIDATPVATFDRHVASFPDEIGADVGGVAARLHVGGQTAVSGDLFALFAREGSDASTRLYDATPYTLVRSTIHPEMLAANDAAVAVVSGILGREVAPSEFTSAPGGGYSAGLTYAIGYLNEASDGAFTGGLRVASTGTLDADGYVDWVSAIDEKTVAAHHAGVDVMFTSTTPSFSTLDTYASTFEGELHRSRRTGTPLGDERGWDEYEAMGERRSDGKMDVVAVAHLGDVAAYLCGAGSEEACAVRAILGDVAIGTPELLGEVSAGQPIVERAALGNVR